jgi:hypothetical protein
MLLNQSSINRRHRTAHQTTTLGYGADPPGGQYRAVAATSQFSGRCTFQIQPHVSCQRIRLNGIDPVHLPSTLAPLFSAPFKANRTEHFVREVMHAFESNRSHYNIPRRSAEIGHETAADLRPDVNGV